MALWCRRGICGEGIVVSDELETMLGEVGRASLGWEVGRASLGWEVGIERGSRVRVSGCVEWVEDKLVLGLVMGKSWS